MREGLTYDDVLLVPKKSPVRSRGDVDTSIRLRGGISLNIPVISSSMDSVTGKEMAQSMADNGGTGIIHRFCQITEQVRMVESVDGTVGAAIGISDEEIQKRAVRLVNSGVDFLCIDVAHGHMNTTIEAVKEISNSYPDLPLMAGAVATYQGAKELSMAGADMIRVGVGPGSSCLTRKMTGVGVPQITAIQDASRCPEASIVADGGIRTPGDIVKSLMSGADAVILGGMLGGCEESLAKTHHNADGDFKEVRGMASFDAQRGYSDRESIYVEGGKYLTPLDGTVEEKMESFEKGIRSGLSYCGANNIEDARQNSEFIKVTPNTVRKNGIYGL